MGSAGFIKSAINLFSTVVIYHFKLLLIRVPYKGDKHG